MSFKISAPNYTQSPNVLFDEIFKTLKEGELRIVLVLIRQTFGWHKEWDQISIRMLADKTGMERRSVQRSIKTLIEQGLVEEKRFGKNGIQRVYFRLVMEVMETEKIDDDEITEEEMEMLSNNSYGRPKFKDPAVQKINTGVISTPTKETFPKEKKQQQTSAPAAAVFSESENEDYTKPPIWWSLREIELPLHDKYEITKRYDEETVNSAVAWATHPQTVITKGLVQAIKWACQTKPELPKNKEDVELVNKNYAFKYDGLKNKNCEIVCCNKYVEIVLCGNCEPKSFKYDEKGFKENFIEALKSCGFKILQ